jgi:hypothetical protein
MQVLTPFYILTRFDKIILKCCIFAGRIKQLDANLMLSYNILSNILYIKQMYRPETENSFGVHEVLNF